MKMQVFHGFLDLFNPKKGGGGRGYIYHFNCQPSTLSPPPWTTSQVTISQVAISQVPKG